MYTVSFLDNVHDVFFSIVLPGDWALNVPDCFFFHVIGLLMYLIVFFLPGHWALDGGRLACA